MCTLCCPACVHALLPRVRPCVCCHRPLLATEQHVMMPSAVALLPCSRVRTRPPTPACSVPLPRECSLYSTSATPLPRTQNYILSPVSPFVSPWVHR
ncbi:hypothetical protein T484DRAFT_1983943 [Baffinella frigidus]|nr:hypothetical protein T484DRAFT_1983943 [Cryptophyta sp. CCMP2293]